MGADGGGYGRNYSVEPVTVTVPILGATPEPDWWIESSRIPDKVYPTSHQNRRRNEWTPTNARNQRKWSRTGR
jgi:hypothetical protein